MYKLYSIIGALAFGGGLTYLGWLIFSGTPSTSGSRRGRMFMQAQDWLIETLGTTGAGGLLMGVGILGGLYFLKNAITD